MRAGTRLFAANYKDRDAFYVKAEKKREYMKLLEEKRAQAKRQQEMLNEKIAKMELERSRLSQSWNSERQMAAASNAYESNIMTETVAGGEGK